MPKKPSLLNQGDKIAIVAPARSVAPEEIMIAKQVIIDKGFDCVESPYLYNSYKQFSDTDEMRAADLLWAFEQQDIKAIFCARGGYGCARLLPFLDEIIIRSNPKWVIGFSDITVLHSYLAHLEMASIHGTMPLLFAQDKKSIDRIFSILSDDSVSHMEGELTTYNRFGDVQGQLVGGNLSVLYSLAGTPYFPDLNDKILYLEDLDEYLYHLDRMLQNFYLNGVFSKIKGLVLGGFTDLHDNPKPFGYAFEEMIQRVTAEYDFPIGFGFKFGHVSKNYPLVNGGIYSFSVSEEENILRYGF